MSRAVANTLLPAERPASTIARPRPRELPVTNHTCVIHPPLSSHTPDILEKLLKRRIGCAMGIRKDLLVTEEIAESSGPKGDPLSSRVRDCLAIPLALASSWKSKGALGALLKIRAPDLSKPIETTEKRTDQCNELEDSDAAKQRSPGLCRDKAEARRRDHLSCTMTPPDTGCSPLCDCEAPKRIGLTMVSILAAISSAGMRLGVWNQRRAAPKTAQAAVVAGSDASAPPAIP